MGKSNVYHNPYDARNFGNPALQRYRAEAYMNSKDVLQANLEKKLLGKLQNGALRLPRGGLVYIVFAGKFLLYMIMLPPYLLFYGAPKWIIQNQFPKIDHALKRLKSIYNNQIKSFFVKWAQLTQKMFNYLKLDLNPLQKQLGLLMKQLGKWNESVQEFRYQTRQFFIYLPNKLAAKVEKLLKSLEKKFANVKNPFLPFQNWASEKAERIEKAFVKAGEIISKPFKVFKTSVIKAQQRVTEVLQPPINWVKEKMKIPLELGKKLINKVKEVVEPRREKLREWSKSMVESGEKAAQQVSQAVQTVAHAIIVPVINLFAPLAIIKTSANKAFGRGKRMGKKLVEKVSKIKNRLKSGSKKLLILAKKGGSLIARAIKYSYSVIKKTPLKLWRFFLKTLAFMVGVARRIARTLHLLYSWTRVLFRYALMEVRKG